MYLVVLHLVSEASLGRQFQHVSGACVSILMAEHSKTTEICSLAELFFPQNRICDYFPYHVVVRITSVIA